MFGATIEQVSKSIHNKAKNIYITICYSSELVLKWSYTSVLLRFLPYTHLFKCDVQIFFLKICFVERDMRTTRSEFTHGNVPNATSPSTM